MTDDLQVRNDCRANIDLVRRLFEAVGTRGDPADFERRWKSYLEMYDPEVVIHEAPSLPYGGDYRGPDAVARHAQGFNQAWDALQAEDLRNLEPRFFANGDEVVVLWRQRGASHSGEQFDMPAASVYRIRDGKVVESRMFHFDAGAVSIFLEHAKDDAPQPA